MDRGDRADEILVWEIDGSGTKAVTQQYDEFEDLSSHGQFEREDPNMDWSDVVDDENVEKVEKRGVMVDVDGIDEEDVQNMTLMTVFSFF